MSYRALGTRLGTVLGPSGTDDLTEEHCMPSPARRLARRYLPHRIRRAGLALAGVEPAPMPRQAPKPAPPKKIARGKPAPPAPPVPAPIVPPPIVEVLRQGGGLAEAVAAQTRHLLGQRQRDVALALATSLLQDPATGPAGALALGIVAGDRDHHALAWFHLQGLPVELWSRYAASEWVRAGLDQDPVRTLGRIEQLADTVPAAVPPEAWRALIGPVFGRGQADLTRQLFRVLDARVADGREVPRGLVVERDWLCRWVSANPDGVHAPASPEGTVSFAILAYDHPGRSRASANIGDHVQSIASLGHVVRHQGLSYEGPQDLVDLLTQLRSRVRPELTRTSVENRVQLLQVDRDASAYSAVPPNTWTLAFCWYMHAIFETRYGLPFHPNLLPIFISFHCSKRDLLSEDTIEHLKTFGPVGCRDWTTVDMLLSIGVPSFFSGCLTTTVRTVFPHLVDPVPEDAVVAYVDMPAASVPAGAPTYAHSDDRVRFRSFSTNVLDGVQLLETYRTEHSGMVTTRLHCYLPTRSLGMSVDFKPDNRSDPRFAGLIDITDAEFDRMQSTLDDRLEQVLTLAFSGAAPAAIYARWAELNAADVAAAVQRRDAVRPLPEPRVDLTAEVERVRSAVTTERSDSVAVAVLVRPEELEALRVLVGSVAVHSARPVQFFLLTRSPDVLDGAALAASLPGHQVEVVNTRGVGDALRAPGKRPREADVDLLVLPDILGAFDRAVVLPAAAVVTGDVAELADLDLQGHLLAAPDPAGPSSVSGFGVLNNAANRLAEQTVASTELRRRAYARHDFDFDGFDTHVLVLDLASWRRHDVVASHQPYLEEFGLSFRELLHLAVGPHRAVIPPAWYQVPSRNPVVDPALVHWAEAPRPWSSDVAPEQQRWFTARDQLGHAKVDA